MISLSVKMQAPSFVLSLLLLQLLLPQICSCSGAQFSPGNIFSPVALSMSLSSDSAAVGESVTVRCHVNPNSEKGLLMTKSSMTLYCPVTDERTFCFQNCVAQAHCHPETRECRSLPELAKVKCRSIKQASGELIYEYTVGGLTSEWFDWRRKGFACASAAETTEWRRLHQITMVEERPPTVQPSTSTTTTTTTTSTTTTATPTTSTTSSTTAAVSTTTVKEEDVKGWFNFLRNVSSNSGSFWTPEMIIVIALVSLALSLIINCFCCVCWIVTRRHKKSTLEESLNHKPNSVQPFGWFPVDPRFSGHPSQQMSPRTAYRLQMDPSGQSLSAASATDDVVAWMAAPGVGLYENGNNTADSIQNGKPRRSHPEGGKVGLVVPGSSMSNSGGGRSSDSGVSMSATAGAAVVATNGSQSPFRYYPLITPHGWSSPGTPPSRGKLHRFSSVEPQQAYFAPAGPPYYAACLELPKRCASRETVFSERALSEVEGRYFIPLVLGGSGAETGSMRAISSRHHLAAFGAPLWNPETSLVEEPGAGVGGVADGASVVADDIIVNNQETGAAASNSGGAGSGSTSYTSSTRPTPRNVYLRQYGSAAMSTINALPSIVPSKIEPKIKSTSPSVNDEVSVTPGPGQNSAEVQKWLQSVPQGAAGKRDFPLAQHHHHHLASKRLADSLNTEFDVASDWSEKDPMLLPKVEAPVTAAADQNSSVS